jgi:hypothetical protein
VLRAAIAGTVAGAAVGPGVAGAGAKNWALPGGNVSTCNGFGGNLGDRFPGDNQDLTYSKVGLTSYNGAAVNAHADYLNAIYQYTHVTANEMSQPTSSTDAVFLDDNYTYYCNMVWIGQPNGGTAAATECVAKNGVGECERSEIRISNHTDTFSSDLRRRVACHETGHALGLLHRPEETYCMYSAIYGITANGYSAHSKNHLLYDLQ